MVGVTIILAVIVVFATFVARWTYTRRRDPVITWLWLLLAGVALGAGVIVTVVDR